MRLPMSLLLFTVSDRLYNRAVELTVSTTGGIPVGTMPVNTRQPLRRLGLPVAHPTPSILLKGAAILTHKYVNQFVILYNL